MNNSSIIAAIKKTESFTASIVFDKPEKFASITQTNDIAVTLGSGSHLDNSFYTINITPNGINALSVDTNSFYIEGVLDSTQHNILYFHYFNAAIRPKCTIVNVPKFLPLSGPTNLVATANSASQITLTWTAVTNATQYILQRATNSGFTTGLTTIYTGSAATFVNTGLTTATTYYYRVMAQAYGFTDSSYSSTANATTS